MAHPTLASNHRRLLITGASGFLGWHLARAAQATWQVEGTYHHHSPPLPGVKLHCIDLTDAIALKEWLAQVAPDAVIHTAALSQPNRCEQEPDLSYAMNVEATRVLAQICGDSGTDRFANRHIPFAFTSTDQVFDGQAAPYDETSPPSPISVYGRHKVEAEAIIQTAHPNAVICRMPLLYGPPSPTAECFLQGFLRTLEAGQPLHLFTDEFRTPAYVEDAAAGLLLALEKASGLLHLGGPDRLSRYDFGLHLAEVFGFDKTLLVPSKQADVPMPAARPADVSSGSRRAIDLGYRPRGVVAGLRATKAWPYR
ncbi:MULTISPECIES: SDR family oxidoreductase [Cyanophyceae]|uniref:SDR family oxidoreductase n=1 Tax=Cyanophyceae TaxID=3028117 RepID=UPI0016893844|nr:MULTISPECIES: SDR family oxidoreductase [Cyanophyceae]MBD1917920.1 SDR family oxidoreductase [Phormidium sp. FACHB-77]MBD2029168.1 SDR family oxidoreductase [Phormidium sp. FACHB-322]MBD2049700.1 SDR family oxidoreductase [Leptolyngbya sp. FACHB-60]